MSKLPIKIKLLNDDAVIPKYQTELAAGVDLHTTESKTIQPNETVLLKTGIAMQIPKGYEGQVRPRSGMSLKTKVRVSNSPGTLDADYRGEVGIILDNIGNETIQINKGDRVAQLVFNQIEVADFELVNDLDETERGDGGFGSTNK